MYRYKNIIVSGDQKVLENDTWYCVRDSKYAKPINIYDLPYIYNIVTSSGNININNVVFRDYCEIKSDNLNNSIDMYVLGLLNKN